MTRRYYGELWIPVCITTDDDEMDVSDVVGLLLDSVSASNVPSLLVGRSTLVDGFEVTLEADPDFPTADNYAFAHDGEPGEAVP